RRIAKRPFDALPETDAVVYERHDTNSQEALARSLATAKVGQDAEVRHDNCQRPPRIQADNPYLCAQDSPRMRGRDAPKNSSRGRGEVEDDEVYRKCDRTTLKGREATTLERQLPRSAVRFEALRCKHLLERSHVEQPCGLRMVRSIPA